MVFATELQSKRIKKLEDYALDFAIGVQPKMIEAAAERGREEITISTDGDAHLLTDEKVIDYLGLLLEGCNVFIQGKERKTLMGLSIESVLVISWQSSADRSSTTKAASVDG